MKALDKITEIFPPEVKLYGDSVYTDYQIEDYLLKNKFVELNIILRMKYKKLANTKEIG